MENAEEKYVELLNDRKIWKKSKLNSEMNWKIWKKGNLISDKIWTIWKKSKLNCEKMQKNMEEK